MHAKAIASSYQRTACTAIKAMSNLIGAGFITTEGAPRADVKYAIVQAEGQALRFTTDGTDPTTTAGFVLAVGAFYRLTPRELRDVKILEQTAGGFANVQLYSA